MSDSSTDGFAFALTGSAFAATASLTCSTHTIDAELLEYIILKDIQSHAEAAINDESLFA